MRVGLVIVTHNSAREIQVCLESIRGQARPPDRIIVSDSGSVDETLAVVAATCARLGLDPGILRFETNVGFAVASNRAVAQLGDCELVALLNPDAFPEREWLASLLDAAAAFEDVGAFASRLMLAGTDNLVDGVGDAFHVSGLAWRTGHGQPLARVPDALQPRFVFSACAAAALYRRDDWSAVGGFDERFFCYAEDIDLGFRLQLLGRSCRYVPEAVVRHVGSAASGIDSPFAVYHGYRNLEWTFIKNMPSPLLWRYFPLHVFANLVQILWFLGKGRGRSLLRAKWDAFRQIRAVLQDRRAVQASRVVSPEVLRGLLDRTSLWSRVVAVRTRVRSDRVAPTRT